MSDSRVSSLSARGQGEYVPWSLDSASGDDVDDTVTDGVEIALDIESWTVVDITIEVPAYSDVLSHDFVPRACINCLTG